MIDEGKIKATYKAYMDEEQPSAELIASTKRLMIQRKRWIPRAAALLLLWLSFFYVLRLQDQRELASRMARSGSAPAMRMMEEAKKGQAVPEEEAAPMMASLIQEAPAWAEVLADLGEAERSLPRKLVGTEQILDPKLSLAVEGILGKESLARDAEAKALTIKIERVEALEGPKERQVLHLVIEGRTEGPISAVLTMVKDPNWRVQE